MSACFQITSKTVNVEETQSFVSEVNITSVTPGYKEKFSRNNSNSFDSNSLKNIRDIDLNWELLPKSRRSEILHDSEDQTVWLSSNKSLHNASNNITEGNFVKNNSKITNKQLYGIGNSVIKMISEIETTERSLVTSTNETSTSSNEESTDFKSCLSSYCLFENSLKAFFLNHPYSAGFLIGCFTVIFLGLLCCSLIQVLKKVGKWNFWNRGPKYERGTLVQSFREDGPIILKWKHPEESEELLECESNGTDSSSESRLYHALDVRHKGKAERGFFPPKKYSIYRSKLRTTAEV